MFKIRPFKLKSGIYAILLISGLMFLGSCRDGGVNSSGNQSTSSTESTTPAPSSADNPGINNIMAGSDDSAGQHHYICVNNCEGSGSDSSGTCPVCGETLLHNDAYHSSGGSENITLPDAGATANASGEHHYICSAGCGGGGPSSGSCPSCGAALVHNDAYHSSGGSESITLPDAGATANASGEHHFVCSAGCGGGGASAGNCPSCGAELVHNDAYHSQGASSNIQSASPSGPNMGDSKVKYPSVFNSPDAPRAAVPQGGGGSGHHYICSAGCGGGGPSQGSCPSCGATLVHNDAYHQ